MWSTSAVLCLGVLGLLRGCYANGQESFTGKLKVIVNRTPVIVVIPPKKTSFKPVFKTTTTTISIPRSTSMGSFLTIQIKDVVISTTVTTSVTTSTSTSVITSPTSTDSTSTLTMPSATTISTPSAFTPIFSSLPNSAARKKKRHALRGAASPLALKSKRAPKTSPKISLKTSPKTYPKQVNCLTTVTSWLRSTVIRTATKAQFDTRDPITTTISTTKTLTSTSWLSTPDALSTSWTTSTIPSTFVTTSTTTTFSASTNTVVVPTYTTTVYAQCVNADSNSVPNNIAGSDLAFGIQAATVPYAQGYYQAFSGSANTPLACCNACAALPLCAMSEFNGNNQAGRQCLLIVSNHATCAFGDYTGQAIISVNGQTIAADSGFFLSNGNCGMFNSHN
ncbi:hypothetical protein FPCIR_3177 [Fusarium pseudocircinatum]|uniref:Apple domain-containing protein n=1 Tax=Fusarium pseudocircinatum TaxID=56676 RepID=A0A8H5UUZ6_9HYPO|nr:hypothetical protein FPCIR_3177 [Fusarium pseudocircinatum]